MDNSKRTAAPEAAARVDAIDFVVLRRDQPGLDRHSEDAELDRMIERHGLVAFDPELFGLN